MKTLFLGNCIPNWGYDIVEIGERGGRDILLTQTLKTMTHAEKHSDELTTVMEAEGCYADKSKGYRVPAPEGAVMASTDLDEEKIAEAEEEAARVAEMCGLS